MTNQKLQKIEDLCNASTPAQAINPIYHGRWIVKNSKVSLEELYLIYQEARFIAQRVLKEPNPNNWGEATSYFQLKSGHYIEVIHTTEPAWNVGICVNKIHALSYEDIKKIEEELKIDDIK